MSTTGSTAFRMTSSQQQRLFACDATGQSFTVATAILVEGPLDPDRLQRATESVAQRYDVFRSVFVTLPGSKALYQFADQSLRPSFAIERPVEPDSGSAEWVEATLSRLAAQRSRRESPSPLQFTLVPLSTARHIFFVTASALVADGRTLAALIDEIAQTYAGEIQPGPTLQYADWVDRQLEALKADDQAARNGRLFWEQQDLASAAAPPLPFEEKLPNALWTRPQALSQQFGADMAERIRAVALRYDASPSSLLLACWYALLWRLCAKEDILIHSLSDGRDTGRTSSAMGLFARPLPLRMQLDPDPSFGEVVRRVAERAADAVRFQSYLAWPDLPAVGHAAPVAFEFVADTPPFAVGDLRFAPLCQQACVQPFKLNLHIDWNPAGARLSFQYGPELLASEAERIARYYVRLLTGLLADPLARISTIDILDEAERRHLLLDLNQTQADYPSDQCIHQLFEAQVERTPNHPAVVFREKSYTYAEFNAAANRVAHLLRSKGVTRGSRVGICLNRSADMLIALFGVLKAGGAYLPLFPEHPKARRAHQLVESEAVLLITQENYLERLPEYHGEIVCLDRDAALLAQQPATNPPNLNTPDDLIYLMYTSGSTGVPKGVCTKHRNVVNYTAFTCKKLALPNDRLQTFALVSYLNADLGKTSIFPPLVSGACVHVIGYDESIDGTLWAGYVARHRIDLLKISPSHICALLASSNGRNVLPRECLIVGGEFFTWSMVERVRQAGDCKIINHYAPTEVTIGCLMYDVDEHSRDAVYAATVPMGRPIDNVDVYILDRHRKPVPLGVPGEIYISGDGLSNGYVNQPAQTAERFVEHPFRPGKLIYRSGDCGRYLPSGAVESLGRSDNQVKIRGFRVELAEIEATLSRHPYVRQAVVIAPEIQPGDRRLSAFVLTYGVGDAPDLYDYLRDQLPDYMVPGEVRVLDTLPLLPNGKVDRIALAALAQTRPEGLHAAPRNHTEKVIANIWAEVLDRKDIGVYDNFFELGGHSLIATTVVARVRNAFDIPLPLRAIFEHATVAELAEVVQQVQLEAADSEEVARALAEVEKLSEEEVRKLLEEAGS